MIATEWTTKTIQRWFDIAGPTGSVLASYWVEAEIAWRWNKGELETDLECWTSEPDPETPEIEIKLDFAIHEYLATEFMP